MAIPELVIGEGPVKVLALNGWFGSAGAGWGGYPDLVDGEKYSVAFLDYRGYGARQDVDGPFTMEAISSDALELADQLGWSSFTLLGHSMGGVAVQRVYADTPDRVNAMIGIAPVHSTPFPWDDDSWALFDGAAREDGNRFGIIDFTTGNRNTPTWVNRMVAGSVANSTREAFGGYLAAWGKADFASEVPQSDQVPVTLIVGAHDPALSAEFVQGTWLKTYPGATVEVVENAGHYPMFEAPVNFTTLVEKALPAG